MRKLFLAYLIFLSFASGAPCEAQSHGVIAVAAGAPNTPAGVVEEPPPTGDTFDLLKFTLHYNTTPYASYLTSAAYSDCSSFVTGQNIIRVATAVPEETHYSVSAMYLYADEPDDERIIFYKTTDAGNKYEFWDNDWNVISTISPSLGHPIDQGNCVDPVHGKLYSYSYNAPNGSVNVYNLSGTFLETLSAPAISATVHWYYDYVNEKFYVSYQGQSKPLQIWERSGNSLVLTETKWYNVARGVCLDNVFDRVVTFEDNNTRIREQTEDGLDEITIYQRSINTNFTEEGITVAPDGTMYCVTPDGYHGAALDGNRMWHFDPRGVYHQYDRSPSMTRFDRFTGGTVTGNFETQKLTQTIGSKIYSPVYDTQGYTNTENASAWTYEFSDGGDANITWRGSNSAPTTTSKTNYYSTIPEYNGWGATSPSAEQGTPGTYRYKQAVLEVKEDTTPALITIQDLIEAINPQILSIEDDSHKMYVYLDDSTLLNQVPIVLNQADPLNNFTNSTEATRFVKQTSYLDDQSTSAQILLTTVSGIASDQQGHLIVRTRREATNTLNTIFSVGTSGSANNRILFKHNSTSGTPASSLVIEQTNGSGTVINRVSVTDTDLTTKNYEFVSTGSAYQIWIDGVSQSLTNDTGSNNGNWFGDLSGVNRAQRGNATGNAGRGRYEFFLYKNTPLTSDMQTLVYNYLAQ